MTKEKIRIKVRKYEDKDFKDYARTILKTWSYRNMKEAEESVRKEIRAIKKEKGEIWVAEVDGKPVGFITFSFTRVWRPNGESFRKKGVGIDWLDVMPEFQRMGVGKKLLERAEKRGREEKLDFVFVNTATGNIPMLNFVTKNGFRFVKYVKAFWGRGTEDSLVLIKELK